MLTVSDLTHMFGTQKLFNQVNIKFTPGNCYGIIGANGAGKSTFLKILSKEIEATSGTITITKDQRMSVLGQDHYAFDDYSVLEAVILGNKRLYDIEKEKEELYSKTDFTDQDGEKAGELEEEFSELGGWTMESDAAILLQAVGISEDKHVQLMKTLSGAEKVKVILAQALFGNPDILILDEPTNDLDIKTIQWFQEFLINYEGIVIVVSHDRYFLNHVCTMIADVDFGEIRLYTGNYDFWYQSSQLASKMLKDQNKKKEDKIAELQAFVDRFSANASKSKQATSRKKLLEKITLDDIVPSNRRYPFIGFNKSRNVGNDILRVENLSKSVDGELLFENLNFMVNQDEKIAFVGDENAITKLFDILAGQDTPDTGEFKWGTTITTSYLPKDNSSFFPPEKDMKILDWLRQYSDDEKESYLRDFLGKMLFSGEEVFKQSSVLSGGEKVRCMLSRMMLKEANVLLLDQPTNHLDLETITSLNNGLNAFSSNILFSSHDHELMNTIATRVIEISSGNIIDRIGNYEEFLELKETMRKQ